MNLGLDRHSAQFFRESALLMLSPDFQLGSVVTTGAQHFCKLENGDGRSHLGASAVCDICFIHTVAGTETGSSSSMWHLPTLNINQVPAVSSSPHHELSELHNKWGMYHT